MSPEAHAVCRPVSQSRRSDAGVWEGARARAWGLRTVLVYSTAASLSGQLAGYPPANVRALRTGGDAGSGVGSVAGGETQGAIGRWLPRGHCLCPLPLTEVETVVRRFFTGTVLPG